MKRRVVVAAVVLAVICLGWWQYLAAIALAVLVAGAFLRPLRRRRR